MGETLRIADYYTPQEKQMEFHDSPATYPLMEGGRGGGKSIALLWEAIYMCLIVNGCNCLLLRRTLTASEKGGIEDHFLKYCPRKFYKSWNGQAHCATFWNGSKLFFGHIKSDRDLSQYQSAEFLFIGWDELTQFTYSQWDYLKGSNRCPIKTDKFGHPVKPRMAGATNPNGIGNGWVKALWITKKPPAGEMVLNYKPEDYHAIHSTFEDNFVYRNDSDYISKLQSISDPVLRAAWIPGDWKILAGQYFQNWEGVWDDVEKKYVGRHVRELGAIGFQDWQDHWISIDWGYAHATCVLWWCRAVVADEFGRTVDELGKPKTMIVCYREFVTRQMNEEALARKIATLTVDPTGRERVPHISRIFLSPDRFNKTNEEHTIADKMGDVLREYNLPRPERANNDRVGGWQLMTTLFDTSGVVVVNSCRDVIESVPKLQRDPKKLEDAIKEGNELFLDVCESFRYGVMSYADENAIPRDVQVDERIKAIKDPTAKYMEYLRITSKPAATDIQVPVPPRRSPWRRGVQ